MPLALPPTGPSRPSLGMGWKSRFVLLHRLHECLSLDRVPGFAAGVSEMRASIQEGERNGWPVIVRQTDDPRLIRSWSGAGPFAFGQPGAAGERWSGFRPLWVQRHNAQGDFRSGVFLYPLFSYSVDESTYRWSVFELMRRSGRRAGAPAPQSDFDPRGDFEIWPFWFSH